MPIKVLIVGAGIAGLSAAIALGRKGHEVEIFEKSAFSNEIGAALHFGPSTTAHVFKAWDFDMEAFQLCRCLRWVEFDVSGNNMKSGRHRYVRLPNVPKGDHLLMEKILEERRRELNFEGDEIMCHRVDAHNYLRQVALSFPRTRLHLSAAIETIDPEAGTLIMRDGAIHKGDLIVGADGIHSKTVQAIAGPNCVPQPAGTCIFRFLVSTENALKRPDLAAWLKSMDYANTMVGMRASSETGLYAVMYPCRKGAILNFGLMFPANLNSRRISTMDWQARSSCEEILEVYDEFPKVFKDLISIGEDYKHWAFAARDPPKTFVKGKLVLIGDAAHPMHPSCATGAVQGVEDAASLGELLDADVASEDLPGRLEIYNRLRYERGVTLKYTSEIGVQGGSKGLENLRRFVPGGNLLEDPEKFIWVYNPIKEAQDALRMHKGLKYEQPSSCATF